MSEPGPGPDRAGRPILVPVRELKGRQLRHEYSGNRIKKLKKAMRRYGFDHESPIRIAEVEGRNVILDGHHRARAAGAVGIREVPAILVAKSPDEKESLLLEAAEAAEQFGLPF